MRDLDMTARKRVSALTLANHRCAICSYARCLHGGPVVSVDIPKAGWSALYFRGVVADLVCSE